MRHIIVKYAGNCKNCGAELEVGQPAMYEKTTGIFCPGCEPIDTEDIRAYRQAKADAKADQLDGWAAKRERDATAKLNSYPEMRHDNAFNTQPGHIPARARMIRADDRAYESLQKAKGMRDRAESIRHVRVKGDADKKKDAKQKKVLAWLKVGMMVDSGIGGTAAVLKINQKTAKLKGRFGDYNVPIHFLNKSQKEGKP